MLNSSLEKPSIIPPSPWVVAHLARIPKNSEVLDLACGQGRHSRLLAAAGHRVLAVDRDADALATLQGITGVCCQRMELEGEDWPLVDRQFAAVVVTNYLWRARLPELLALVQPGGVLIYETFMVGNAAYGKPSRPDFLLQPGELRQVITAAGLQEIDFCEGYVEQPKPAMRQAICAVRPLR